VGVVVAPDVDAQGAASERHEADLAERLEVVQRLVDGPERHRGEHLPDRIVHRVDGRMARR
jgi:hypothetical protein